MTPPADTQRPEEEGYTLAALLDLVVELQAPNAALTARVAEQRQAALQRRPQDEAGSGWQPARDIGQAARPASRVIPVRPCAGWKRWT
jgi:hypothetical protein